MESFNDYPRYGMAIPVSCYMAGHTYLNEKVRSAYSCFLARELFGFIVSLFSGLCTGIATISGTSSRGGWLFVLLQRLGMFAPPVCEAIDSGINPRFVHIS